MSDNILTKSIYYFFLTIFICVGIYSAINVGITHDEFHEYYVSEANKNFILNKIFNTTYDTSYLTGISKYYGSGFHYFSSPLEFLIKNLSILKYENNLTNILLSKHISVFFTFLISGLIFKKIIKIITNDEFQAKLSTIFYLLYPYLFGHSLFNVKDIPFLSLWLICTYLFIKIINSISERKKIQKKHLFLLTFATGFLLSIRISGILIFFNYLIFILTFLSLSNTRLFLFIKQYYKDILIFVSLTLILFISLQPSYWNDPLLVFQAIKAMSQHIQTVCTITLGECMPAQNLPSTYLPIWFFFKLPLIVIIGLLLFFIIEKGFKNREKEYLIFLSLLISTSGILILLILFNVNLYDEIRQVMFLIPSIFILSLSSLFIFSKKIFNFSIIFFILFFALQNIKIYPYNYIWINNFSHFTKVENIFELDYWGVSTRNIAYYFKNKADNFNHSKCIISNRNNGLELFLSKNQCFINFKNVDKDNKRPFYISFMERKIKKGDPNNCKLIHEETRNLNFSTENIVLANIFRCD